jgi:hypothetical protein
MCAGAHVTTLANLLFLGKIFNPEEMLGRIDKELGLFV